MSLRPYQAEALAACREWMMHNSGNPIIELPTGAGKTHVIAEMCMAANAKGVRSIVLAHRKELLEQGADKLRRAAPDLPIGIYSASIGAKDPHKPVTFGGIQSVFRRASAFDPPLGLVIIDEAHRVPKDGEGMYQTFLKGVRELNPVSRVVGLTATPYRLDSGPICQPGVKGNIFDAICYRANVADLIEQGYLCKLRSKGTTNKPDVKDLRILQGEYRESDFDAAMSDKMVREAVAEFLRLSKDRKSILVFASGVNHGTRIVAEMKRQGVGCGDLPGSRVAMVTGETDMDTRGLIVEAFKAGDIRILVNVMVFTEGFDAPNVDCVVILRATTSAGLYYQCCGRGLRTAPDKHDCMILDYGSNIQRHGPIDDVRYGEPDRNGKGGPLVRECPACGEVIPIASRKCPVCEFEFPRKDTTHDTEASTEEILASGRPVRLEVNSVRYVNHHTDPAKIPTMRVDYHLTADRKVKRVSEWVCFEHTGYAKSKAASWWIGRSGGTVPMTVPEAVLRARRGDVREPTHVTVQRERIGTGINKTLGKYDRVLVAPADLKPRATVEVARVEMEMFDAYANGEAGR